MRDCLSSACVRLVSVRQCHPHFYQCRHGYGVRRDQLHLYWLRLLGCWHSVRWPRPDLQLEPGPGPRDKDGVRGVENDITRFLHRGVSNDVDGPVQAQACANHAGHLHLLRFRHGGHGTSAEHHGHCARRGQCRLAGSASTAPNKCLFCYVQLLFPDARPSAGATLQVQTPTGIQSVTVPPGVSPGLSRSTIAVRDAMPK